MDWITAKDFILGFLASGIGLWAIGEIHQMRKSLERLNIQLAIIVERNTRLEKDVEQLQDKVERIEFLVQP